MLLIRSQLIPSLCIVMGVLSACISQAGLSVEASHAIPVPSAKGFCQLASAEAVLRRTGEPKRREEVRLAVSHPEVEPGEAVKARVLNLTSGPILTGARFSIQRYTQARGWETDPSSPDGPWPMRARRVHPSDVAECYRFPVPPGLADGRYRFLADISLEGARRRIKGTFVVDARANASATPAALSVKAQRSGAGYGAEIEYRITATAGATEAAAGFEYQLPDWPTSPFVTGSPIKVVSVDLEGQGRLHPVRAPLPKPSLPRRKRCLRSGTVQLPNAYWVEVPANASAVVVLRARATFPSWPTARYEVRFSTFASDSATAPRSFLETLSVGRIGPRGRHIRMRIVRNGGNSGRRMTPEIVGSTEPALRSARVSLRAVRPSASYAVRLSDWLGVPPASVPLGSVRTDRRGQFRLSAQAFPYSGTYAILARSERQHGVAADWNCGPFF
jgi:hypothetical protein